MQHTLAAIANSNRFNTDHFVKFCAELSSTYFNVENNTTYVSTWYVDDVVNLYRERISSRFTQYLNHLGFIPSLVRRTPTGWEAILNESIPADSAKRFSRIEGNKVSLDYADFSNKEILGDFVF